MTAGRTYLSIGDVLTLLRQEFPDVTISKIRFLESQGLVNPERTPSGYRKFYDHDVERLRWVLRQQREHFLPLKVIKGRLEDETSGPADSRASIGNGRHGDEPEAPDAVGVAEVVELDARGPADRRGEIPDHLPGFDPPVEEQSIGLHLAGEGAGRSRALPTASAGNPPRHAAERRAGHSRAGNEDPTFGGGLKAPWAGSAAGQDPASDTGTPSGTAGPGSAGSGSAGSLPGSTGSRPGPRAAQVARATGRVAEGGVPAVPGPTRLTLAEAAAATGMTESAIEELASYGILKSRNVGGIEHFDESELPIAQVAGEFARFGIEARHLRLYKHASEREAGFVEQLVLPLLKQRNPEARKRAGEMVEDLTRLGEELRAAMVRRSLQDLFGG
jgi:DNA-binding transcriptional MerR regulator